MWECNPTWTSTPRSCMCHPSATYVLCVKYPQIGGLLEVPQEIKIIRIGQPTEGVRGLDQRVWTGWLMCSGVWHLSIYCYKKKCCRTHSRVFLARTTKTPQSCCWTSCSWWLHSTASKSWDWRVNSMWSPSAPAQSIQCMSWRPPRMAFTKKFNEEATRSQVKLSLPSIALSREDATQHKNSQL